jgi:hypothetical protein
MNIIILAALQEEAEAFLPGAGTPLFSGWLAGRRLSVHGHDIIAATTGIGKVNMSAAAARLHALHGADLFIVTGTAGKIGTLAGDCFFLARAIQHDYGAERPGRFVHYSPGAWPIGPAAMAPLDGLPDPGTGLAPVSWRMGSAPTSWTWKRARWPSSPRMPACRGPASRRRPTRPITTAPGISTPICSLRRGGRARRWSV